MASSASDELYTLKYASVLACEAEQVDPTLSVILASALKNNPKNRARARRGLSPGVELGSGSAFWLGLPSWRAFGRTKPVPWLSTR